MLGILFVLLIVFHEIKYLYISLEVSFILFQVINIQPTFSSLSSEVILAKAPPKRELKRQGRAVSEESNSTDTSEGSSHDGYFPLKVRGGLFRRLGGYQVSIDEIGNVNGVYFITESFIKYCFQPDLVCLVPWRNLSQPEAITAMALNSSYGIIALGFDFPITVLLHIILRDLIFGTFLLVMIGCGQLVLDFLILNFFIIKCSHQALCFQAHQQA